MAREKILDNKVLDFLKSIGAWRLKYWAGSAYTKSGVPDILACVSGSFVAVEDKAKTGKPTLLQLKNLEWIRDAGGYGILLYPDDFDNFKRFINEISETNDFSDWARMWYASNISAQKAWKEKLSK